MQAQTFDYEAGSSVHVENTYRNNGYSSPIATSPTSQKNLNASGTFWDALSFGICLASTNLFIEWELGLVNGYWEFLVALFITASTFTCLHLCIAEMVSILPFSGNDSYSLSIFANFFDPKVERMVLLVLLLAHLSDF